MWRHVSVAAPSLPDLQGRTWCQRDDFVCRGNQDFLLLGVGVGPWVVRVAQIVHGVHQGLAVDLQLVHHVGQDVGAHGVEAGVHVKHVETVVVTANPSRFQHQRWPPATWDGAPVGRNRISKAHNSIGATGCGEVADVDVRARHGGDMQQSRTFQEFPSEGPANARPLRSALWSWSQISRCSKMLPTLDTHDPASQTDETGPKSDRPTPSTRRWPWLVRRGNRVSTERSPVFGVCAVLLLIRMPTFCLWPSIYGWALCASVHHNACGGTTATSRPRTHGPLDDGIRAVAATAAISQHGSTAGHGHPRTGDITAFVRSQQNVQ